MPKLFEVELARSKVGIPYWYLSDGTYLFNQTELDRNFSVPSRIKRLTAVAFSTPGPNRVKCKVGHDGIGLILTLQGIFDCMDETDENGEEVFCQDGVTDILKQHKFKEGDTFYIELRYGRAK